MTSQRKEQNKKRMDEAAEILGFEDEPAGSLAPLDSTKGAKWERAINAQSLTDLAEIATQIETTIRETVETVARSRLRIGRLLNDAREKFPGDKEFGQWRKAVLPDLKPSTCHQYQQMANHFKNAPAVVEAVGWSVCAEVMHDPGLRAEAWERASNDAKPNMTVAEARELKAPSNEPSPQTSGDKPKPPAPEQIESAVKKQQTKDKLIENLLAETPAERCKSFLCGDYNDLNTDEYSCCAIIFGFWPDLCDSPPNISTFLAVYDYTMSKVEEDDHKRLIEQAYSKMKEVWK